MKDELFALWNPLRKYMTCMRHAAGLWEDFLLAKTIDWIPHDQVEHWLQRLKNTLNILEESHIYDELSSLSVSSQSSGFPELRHLHQVSLMSELPVEEKKTQDLKQAFLDSLFVAGSVNVPLLEKVGKARAYELYKSTEVMEPFQMTAFREVQSSTGQRAFVCSWERYVVQPLPVKYVMLFEVSGKWSPDEERLGSLKRLLQEETSLILSLEDFARSVDRSHADIHPKWIGRIILGPVFISHLTQDDHQLQQVLNTSVTEDEFLSASRIIYEYLVAEGEEPVRSLIDSQGVRHTRLQKYAVRKDGEHYDRGVTHLEKHLFAPHEVIQKLDNEYRKTIGHRLNSY